MEKMVPKRVDRFIAFVQKLALQDAGKLKQKNPSLGRRRGKVSFLMDRTFMFVAMGIVDTFGSEPELLMFALFFIVVGCTHLRNARVATATSKDDVNDSQKSRNSSESYMSPSTSKSLQTNSGKLSGASQPTSATNISHHGPLPILGLKGSRFAFLAI